MSGLGRGRAGGGGGAGVGLPDGETGERGIRLLIADDEHLIRGALVALLGLEPDIEVVATAENGVAAVEQAIATRPDVCLLDLEMPEADGLEAATCILATVPTRVVIVTRHARPGVLRRALASKVSGFVPKSTPAEDLAHVIRDVAAGRRSSTPRSRRPRSPPSAARSPIASSTRCATAARR